MQISTLCSFKEEDNAFGYEVYPIASSFENDDETLIKSYISSLPSHIEVTECLVILAKVRYGSMVIYKMTINNHNNGAIIENMYTIIRNNFIN